MDEYLTENQMAERLQISRTTLYQLRKEGMPCLRVNRMVRYRLEDVEKFLAERAHRDAYIVSRNIKGD